MKMTLGTGAATNALDDIELAHTILVAGVNPTEGHPVTGARIKQAARHGAKLIVVSPRWGELVPFATAWLQPTPGHEALAVQARLRERTRSRPTPRSLSFSTSQARKARSAALP